MEVIAVVRTHGERTAGECIRRVREQVAEVRVLDIAPFSDAVRECFRIGRAAKWLLTVDGDVLLNPGAADRLIAQARKMKGWQVVGVVHDKLADRERMAGVRLYRGSSLQDVLPHVSDTQVRPEGALARLFGGWEMSERVVGLHDHEQWRRDYHRKGAQHRVKHPDWAKHVERVWKRGDDDLKAAYQGWHGLPLTIGERDGL